MNGRPLGLNNRILLPVFFLVFAHCLLAQDTLSINQYFGLTYKLKSNIIAGDSSSIAANFSSIAPKLFADTEPFTNKLLRDSGILSDVYYTLIYAALYKSDYPAALSYINRARQVGYKKKHSLPPFILEKALAESLVTVNNSINADEVFSQSIVNDLNLIDRTFLKDVANQSKASFALGMAANNERNVNTYISESLKKDSTIIMYNMPFLMKLFLTSNIIKQKHAVLQSILETISPEKILAEDVKIRMRDGIHLAGILFRDSASSDKTPVIISLSPYPSGGEAVHGNIFAVNGYAFLYVDCRGRRKSEGEFFPFENDSRDYYDIIDWASKQPWCSGKVATTGGSYLGFTQWQAIKKKNRHPALKAINPMAAVGFGIDFPRNNNCFNTYSLQWAQYVNGTEMDEALFEDYAFWKKKAFELYKYHLPFNSFDSVVGIKNRFFKKWLSHPDLDEYWRDILPSAKDYQALNIPVLTTTGYYDSDQNGALYYYKNHQQLKPANNHYVIIGPFDHAGSQWMPKPTLPGGGVIDEEAQIPLYKLVIQWFDWALKAKPLPEFFQDKVNYYVPGDHIWKAKPTLSKITNDSLNLYLESNVDSSAQKGTLSSKPSLNDRKFSYSHDIFSTLDSLIIFSPEQVNNRDSIYNVFNSGLTFQSEPLQKDITLTGALTAHIYASLNVKDADIAILYFEVDDSGNETFISSDKLRTRYRYSASNPQLMTPGITTLLHFNNAFITAQKIKKGNKIKIYILIENEMYVEKNYGFGGVVSSESAKGSRKIELTVYSGKRSKSYISIPIE